MKKENWTDDELYSMLWGGQVSWQDCMDLVNLRSIRRTLIPFRDRVSEAREGEFVEGFDVAFVNSKIVELIDLTNRAGEIVQTDEFGTPLSKKRL